MQRKMKRCDQCGKSMTRRYKRCENCGAMVCGKCLNEDHGWFPNEDDQRADCERYILKWHNKPEGL